MWRSVRLRSSRRPLSYYVGVGPNIFGSPPEGRLHRMYGTGKKFDVTDLRRDAIKMSAAYVLKITSCYCHAGSDRARSIRKLDRTLAVFRPFSRWRAAVRTRSGRTDSGTRRFYWRWVTVNNDGALYYVCVVNRPESKRAVVKQCWPAVNCPRVLRVVFRVRANCVFARWVIEARAPPLVHINGRGRRDNVHVCSW